MTDRFDQEIRNRDRGHEDIISSLFLERFPERKINLNKDLLIIKEEKIIFNKILKKEPGILLYDLRDTSFLETPQIRERSDRFITREFELLDREYFSRGERNNLQSRPLPADIPEIPSLDSKKRFSSTTGLSARVVTSTGIMLTVRGETVTFPDNRYTRVDFAPKGRTYFVTSKMTDSLAKGIRGIKELVDALDSGTAELEPVFVGVTNINMALIAQRLGFTIVDECRTADGNIDKSLARFTIVGKITDVRAKVKQFEESGAAQRINSRAQRLTLKPA